MKSRSRITQWRVLLVACLALSLTGVAPLAAQVSLTPDPLTCVVAGGNTPVMLMVQPFRELRSVRVYFRAVNEPEDYYFLEMRADSGGRFWAVLPIPERSTNEVQAYFRVLDGQGQVTETTPVIVPVERDCRVDLNRDQEAFARNLVVGETAVGQQNQVVLGFQCPGLVSRVDIRGELRPDEVCRGVLIAMASKKDILIPALLLGGAVGGAVILDRRDPSPSQP